MGRPAVQLTNSGRPTERPNLFASMLGWLRKGYPEGIPAQDSFPLIALLRHRLTDAELDHIVADLMRTGLLAGDHKAVAEVIARVAEQEPTDDDLAQVAGRLAAAGWPLAGHSQDALPNRNRPAPAVPTPVVEPSPAPEPGHGARASIVGSIVGWLRAGYPQGVPEKDYIPLLALLRRRLTDQEIGQVADEIMAQGQSPFGLVDIKVLITKLTDELPTESDVDRVRVHLEKAGWPVQPVKG